MAIAATAAKFRKTGDTLDYTPSAAVTAGTILVVDGLNCIAQWDLPANVPNTVKVLHRGEVIEVTTDEAIGSTNAETAIYVVAATGLVTKTSTSNVLLGYARAAIGASDLSFEVVCA